MNKKILIGISLATIGIVGYMYYKKKKKVQVNSVPVDTGNVAQDRMIERNSGAIYPTLGGPNKGCPEGTTLASGINSMICVPKFDFKLPF